MTRYKMTTAEAKELIYTALRRKGMTEFSYELRQAIDDACRTSYNEGFAAGKEESHK